MSAVHSQAERIAGADATGGDPVFVTGAGKLGTINPPSSARFKEEIKPMNEASEVILGLNPLPSGTKKSSIPSTCLNLTWWLRR